MSLEEQINAIIKKDGFECTGEFRNPIKNEMYFNKTILRSDYCYTSNCFPILRKIAPPTRPMTDAEIFKALRDGAVVKNDCEVVTNSWGTLREKSEYQICYSYTGTDSDKWQKLEV